MVDVESIIPHELPSSPWLKATGQCVLERYLSATMGEVSKDSHVTAQNAHSFPSNSKNLWGGRLGPFDKYAVNIAN